MWAVNPSTSANSEAAITRLLLLMSQAVEFDQPSLPSLGTFRWWHMASFRRPEPAREDGSEHSRTPGMLIEIDCIAYSVRKMVLASPSPRTKRARDRYARQRRS
jgi:hypothetical protein